MAMPSRAFLAIGPSVLQAGACSQVCHCVGVRAWPLGEGRFIMSLIRHTRPLCVLTSQHVSTRV